MFMALHNSEWKVTLMIMNNVMLAWPPTWELTLFSWYLFSVEEMMQPIGIFSFVSIEIKVMFLVKKT